MNLQQVTALKCMMTHQNILEAYLMRIIILKYGSLLKINNK